MHTVRGGSVGVHAWTATFLPEYLFRFWPTHVTRHVVRRSESRHHRRTRSYADTQPVEAEDVARIRDRRRRASERGRWRAIEEIAAMRGGPVLRIATLPTVSTGERSVQLGVPR